MPAVLLRCADQTLDLTRPVVMGVLNVTPDSFYDGGRFSALDAAVAQGVRMAEEGAALIDVGGESTRPGAEPVAAAVSDRFILIYGPAEAEQQDNGSQPGEAAFEPLNGDVIDIGEAVAQELSLSLPVFPRHPDAKIDAGTSVETPIESAGGPFISLTRLKQRVEC